MFKIFLVSDYCGKPIVDMTNCTGIFEPVNDINPLESFNKLTEGVKEGVVKVKEKWKGTEKQSDTQNTQNENSNIKDNATKVKVGDKLTGAENQFDTQNTQNENSNSKDDFHITVCDKWTKELHFPLIIASSTIVVFLLLSCISIYALHRVLNPIGMLLFSRKFRLGNIWPEDRDQKLLLGPVLHFVLEPSKDTLEESNEKLRNKTGEDLIDVSIKHGYGQVIESILSPDVGHAVSGGLLRKALLEGDIKVIKIILGAAKGSEGTLEVDQTKLDAVINELPKVRGMSLHN